MLKQQNKIIFQDNKILKFLIESPKYGQFEVIIDTEDWDRIKNYKWCITYNNKKLVAVVTAFNGRLIYLHDFILNEKLIDHADMNPLLNCKFNLRKCNKMQNAQNRGLNKNNISGFKGVSWSKSKNKWRAYININYKQLFLGYFSDKIKAAQIYNDKAKELFGNFARLNII
jgi:hypothetical protein